MKSVIVKIMNNIAGSTKFSSIPSGLEERGGSQPWLCSLGSTGTVYAQYWGYL